MQLETKLKRRTLLASGAAALIAAGGAATWLLRRQPQDQGTPTLKAGTLQGDLPTADPAHAAWQSAPSLAVKVLPQQLFYPKLKAATIQELQVRALWNGTQLAFHLEWPDGGKDELESIVRFRDAVAVMLPLDPAAETPVTMGAAGKPVYVLQWKASWQVDLDKGFQGVEASYPRWFNDVYPGHPTLEQLGMDAKAAQTFYPGQVVGNPLSRQQRASPVEELVAEGFGTLTSLATQQAKGRGMHGGGRWQVTLAPPASGADVPALKPGLTTPVAFAIWEGGNRQVGGRKHYANWVNVTLP